EFPNKSTGIISHLFNLLPLLVTFIGIYSNLLWISSIVQNHDWSFLTSIYWNT
ncbi:unnamed protein product, partial [Schistosoma spindalis]